MDIGCGLQVANRFLSAIGGDINYFGIDYEAGFKPDAVVDINQHGSLRQAMTWAPDVVMMLDVLEHLHDNQHDLERVIENVAHSMPKEAKLVITVPQLYRLDSFKPKHLPYLTMLSKRYSPDNALGRLFNHLRSRTFEKPWLKPVDLFLSNMLGRLPVLKRLSNDILFVATVRQSNGKSKPR